MMQPFSIYFPQFYPTPTNDRIWGKGFTDWVLLGEHNVRLADADRRAPAQGFYDGADPRVHQAQIASMKAHGLGGLGLYHYWFFSHQELDAFEKTLLEGTASANMPWFLIWATENWTRRWLGDHRTTVAFNPDPDDAQIEAHCRYLSLCFSSPSYYRWRDRPLFVWYNLAYFTQPGHVVERYRQALQRLGHDVAMANFIKNASDIDLCVHTDASYVFEPRMFFNLGRNDRGKAAKLLFDSAISLIGRENANRLIVTAERLSQAKGRLFSAEAFMTYLRSEARAELLQGIAHGYQDVLSPGWDNRPRYRNNAFTALENLSPEQFAQSLAATPSGSGLPPLINAWNEWTERAAIEPCAYLGSRYLDALPPV